MNVKIYVRALLCLCLSLSFAPAPAQSPGTLQVGDTLPPELWDLPLEVIQHPEGTTLSAYKDKLIILDFWATWCAPCVKSLNKLKVSV